MYVCKISITFLLVSFACAAPLACADSADRPAAPVGPISTHAAPATTAPAPRDVRDIPERRAFLFTYGGRVAGLAPGQAAHVWLPVPPNDGDQKVTVERRDVPAWAAEGVESRFGNRVLYFEAKADGRGEVPFSVTYRVERREVGADDDCCGPRKIGEEAEAEEKLFLQPDQLVPVGGKPLELLEGKDLPPDATRLARELYDLVNDHMQHRKDRPGWGRGDAAWACESRFGNCTDFHSLFISLARSKKLPAKFEIGFALPEDARSGDIAGYHCWAKFKPPGEGWVPVDISEANRHPELKEYYFGHLTPDRVMVSVGRDLVLTPKQDGPPLNFFVYPYVEVDGRPWEQVERRTSFRDVASDEKDRP